MDFGTGLSTWDGKSPWNSPEFAQAVIDRIVKTFERAESKDSPFFGLSEQQVFYMLSSLQNFKNGKTLEAAFGLKRSKGRPRKDKVLTGVEYQILSTYRQMKKDKAGSDEHIVSYLVGTYKKSEKEIKFLLYSPPPMFLE